MPPSNETDPSHADETTFFPIGGESNKQEQDIAFAAELIRSGLLSDRQLAAAVGDWSVHGSVPLAEHLRQRNVLPSEQVSQIEERAGRRAAASTTPVDDDTPPSANDSLGALLARHDESGRVARLLGVSAASGVADRSTRRTPARYDLLRKLGQGGLGRVWLARDNTLGRLVALKEVTNAAQVNEVTLDRFRNEAEITGRLEHPGIVPIYQLGDDVDTGNAFYTMRFLGKNTLQDAIDEYHERREAGDDDPMLLRHLLTAFVNICHAIGHAHSRKVIHRDLKPENVVIDSFGQVIVIDWGLAKLVDEAALEQLGPGALSGEHSSTVEGQVLGTPLYMAPEQAAGRLDEVDERTDIYGLGAVLFAVITGHAPHEKIQTHAAHNGGGPRALISGIASGATPQAHESNPEVDPALAAICAKAMARRRYARYQSATDLAEEVQRWMADEPITAYQEPPSMQVRRWIKQHERLSQVMAAMAAILVAAVVTMGVLARQAALTEQQSRFEQMRGDAREVELQLLSSSHDLSGDTRFMAGLPPIQGIINALAGVEGDNEAVWRGRLEKIFTGLLRSEPDYLAVAYVAAVPAEGKEHFSAKELIRVERSVSERTVLRSLPVSRLREFEEDPFLESTLMLEPGDTLVSMNPRPWQSPSASHARRLTIATPIYSDATGDPFGMVVIENDIVRHLQVILDGLGQRTGDVFIADAEGLVWAASTVRDGATTKWNGRHINELVPPAAPLFASPTAGDELDDGATFYAKFVSIHPAGKGAGIVVALPHND